MGGEGGSLVFDTVALLSGALVGTFVRAALAGAISDSDRHPGPVGESLVGLGFGAVLALPFLSASAGEGWAPSGLGGALIAYGGACAAYAFARARKIGANPLSPAIVRFAAASVWTGAGFVGLLLIWIVFR